MHYEGRIIRPPSEAASIILQITVGCSHNTCSFCGAYKDVKFRIKDDTQVDDDLNYAAQHFPRTRKLFLADGDALILSQARLVRLLQKIRKKLPAVKRVRVYGNAKSILSKTPEQLCTLRELGLDRIYMGLESGDEPTLTMINKWGNRRKMVRAAALVKDAHIFLSVTILLGIAGKQRSLIHAKATAEILNIMSPNQIAALTLMLIPGTPLYTQYESGAFTMANPQQILQELRALIAGITLNKTQFQANHASNYLPINCRLPRDKDQALADIDLVLAGRKNLVPDYMRGL